MSRGPSRAITLLRATGFASLGVLVAVAVLVDTRARIEQEDAGRAARAAARAALPLARAIQDRRDPAAIAADPATRSVAVGDVDAPAESVAALARDTGLPVLDEVQGGLVVTARYDPSGPMTVADRRASLVGYLVTPLRLEQVLDALPVTGGSVAVLGPTTRVAAASGFATLGPAARYDVPLEAALAPGWRLQAATARSPLPLTAWLAALLALLTGILAAGATVRRDVLERQLRTGSRRREDTDATLAELASIAQSSLDLAEVLPASCALLQSALELDGLALHNSGTRPTFVWHNAPGEEEPARPPSAPVPAGSCVAIPLTRGGRSLGTLRVRPRRQLDEVDLRLLVTAAETLSSAIANADAYSHQRSLIARMRSLDNLKTVFVATASHELRTPVAAVVGYASMLTDNWESLDSETGLLYARRVEGNAQRLAALVENLLDFARLEQGRAHPGVTEPLDLGSEVRALIEGDPDLAPDHVLRVAAQPGLVVAGSRLAIERVLTNLVGNAAKYSPAGTTIWVRVEGAGTAARLIVDDEGPGVPAHERDQVFSRFFRGGGDAVTRTQGAGLGLAIVTEFAAFMDGTVSIDEAPGGGTRFVVTLPLSPTDAVSDSRNQGETP